MALILILGSGIAYSQLLTGATIEKFTSSLEKFHKRLLSAGAHANLLATTPSTANLMKFPHWSLGMGAGISFDIHGFSKLLGDPQGSLAAVSSDNMFSHIPGLGLGTAATLRFGGAHSVPFDAGFHVMYIPINHQGLNFSKVTVGGDIRFVLVKDEEKKPGLSIGLKYVYTLNKWEWFWNNMSFKATSDAGTISISLQDPKAAFNLSEHLISMPLQLSKLFASFFEPYIGAEPFIVIGSFALATNIDPVVKWKNNERRFSDFVREYKIKSDIFNDKGVNYNHVIINGGVRLYGGFALKLWKFYLDFQGSYEPVNHEWGVGTGLRFQY